MKLTVKHTKNAKTLSMTSRFWLCKSVAWKIRWVVTGKLMQQDVTFKLDTGAQVYLLPHSLFTRLKIAVRVCPSKTTLTSYKGNVIDHFGTASLPPRLGNKEQQVTFFIVEKGRQALLALSTWKCFGLVTLTHAISKQ